MSKNRTMIVLGLLVVASMVLSACGTPAPAEPAEPVVVTQEVVVTEVVEVEREAFTTPHPILGDLKVRQALSYCTNKSDLLASVYPLTERRDPRQLGHAHLHPARSLGVCRR
jgi:hypothetical protein